MKTIRPTKSLSLIVIKAPLVEIKTTLTKSSGLSKSFFYSFVTSTDKFLCEFHRAPCVESSLLSLPLYDLRSHINCVRPIL
jgi:hypothetical protein